MLTLTVLTRHLLGYPSHDVIPIFNKHEIQSDGSVLGRFTITGGTCSAHCIPLIPAAGKLFVTADSAEAIMLNKQFLNPGFNCT